MSSAGPRAVADEVSGDRGALPLPRILFVDDEVNVLEGLRSAMRRQRKVWSMDFACGGAEAIRRFEQGEYDIVVSDMRMPGVDGSALLRWVHERHPDVVRVILSGQSEHESIFGVLAHQILAKPCPPETLTRVLDASCALRRSFRSPALRGIVGDISSLPALPTSYRAITACLADPDAPMASLGKLVEQDAALASRVLQVANSAAFRRRSSTNDIGQAVCYLGVHLVRALALALAAERSFDVPRHAVEKFHARAFLVASLARRLLSDPEAQQEAFTAGLLHDVGALVLMAKIPQRVAEIEAHAIARSIPRPDAERELLGATHAEVGAYLLGLWALPHALLEVAMFHHTPSLHATSGLDSLLAVHVATALVDEAMRADDMAPGGALDFAFLESLGLSGRIDEWRAWGAEILAEGAP